MKAQSILGTWEISSLITQPDTKEYYLDPIDTNLRLNYGNRISIVDSNRFYTYYTAPCGLDCFTHSSGKYVLTDQNHVQFIVEKVSYSGTCSGKTSEHPFPLDIGLYYIHRTTDKIRLIKSDGDLVQDKLNANYSDLIDENVLESRNFENLLEYIEPDIAFEKSPEAIASFYYSGSNSSDYRVLYSKESDRGQTIVLLEKDNEFKYLFCYTFRADSSEQMYVSGVAIYDKDFVDQIDQVVNEINENRHKLKTNITTEIRSSSKSTVTLYKRGNKIKVIAVEKESPAYNSKLILEYYFKKEKLICIKRSHMRFHEENEYVSSKMFYLTGVNQFISKKLSSEITEVDSGYFHASMKELEIVRKNLELDVEL